MSLKTNAIRQVMGAPDDLKLKSCLTLFAIAAPGEPIFTTLLDKYFGGEKDLQTLELLQE